MMHSLGCMTRFFAALHPFLIASLLAAASLVLNPSPAIAQAPAAEQKRALAFTVSGGVSKGSYQGGFGFGLTYLMRASRESQEARDSLNLFEYDLAAATGASAGNINALLAAVSWCDATMLRQRPENSLFWKIWIPVGIEQLFPRKRPDLTSDASEFLPDLVLSRRFFQTEVKARLVQSLKHPARDHCSVPLGLTTTRIDKLAPVTLAPDALTVGTIRYAAVANLRSYADDENLSRMAFGPYDFSGLDIRQFGKLILPIFTNPTTPGEAADRGAGPMVDVALASSAFPIAFAPVELRFRSSPGSSTTRGLFIDGGVFDNNPIGLSQTLYAPRLATTESSLAEGTMMKGVEELTFRPSVPDNIPVYSLLVDEDNRLTPTRTDSFDGSTMVETATRQNLISVRDYGSFLSNAISTARSYELEILARELTEQERERLEISSRYHAFTGGSLFAFGGFLSYLFREHDFYVGVYDAVYYLAAESVAAQTAQTATNLTPQEREATEAEVGERMLTLINRLNLSDNGRQFLLSLHRREIKQDRKTCSTDEPIRENVYVAISCAASAWETKYADDTRSISGLALLFTELNQFIPRSEFFAEEEAACRREAERAAARDPGAFACSAINDDGLLRQISRSTGPTLTQLSESALEILRQNEITYEKRTGEPSAKTLITLSYFSERNLATQRQTGFSWDSSTLPSPNLRSVTRSRWKLGLWRALAPRELSTSIIDRRLDGYAVGYRPHYRPRFLYPRTGIGLIFPLRYADYRTSPDFIEAGMGVQTVFRTQSWSTFLQSIEVRATTVLPHAGLLGGQRPGLGDYVGYELAAYVLFGKIRIGYHDPSFFRSADDSGFPGYEGRFILGLADLNGLIYWGRQFFR